MKWNNPKIIILIVVVIFVFLLIYNASKFPNENNDSPPSPTFSFIPKNCGANKNCINDAIKKCEKATYSTELVLSLTINVEGFDGTICKVYTKVVNPETGNMVSEGTCKMQNYTEGLAVLSSCKLE